MSNRRICEYCKKTIFATKGYKQLTALSSLNQPLKAYFCDEKCKINYTNHIEQLNKTMTESYKKYCEVN
jgi:hypothetical protein